MRLLFLLLIILNSFCFAGLDNNQEEKTLTFSNEEKKWIEKNPLIKLAYMKDWPSDDQGRNIHTQLLRLLNKYSGLNFTFAKFDTWKEGFKEASTGDNIHGIMSLSWTKEREENYFYYTKPYNFIPANIIVRKNNNNIASLDDLVDKTVYLKEGSSTNNIIKDTSFNISIINLASEELMLERLSLSNEAQAVLTHNVKQQHLDKYGLKVVKSFFTKYSELSIGVNKKHKDLQSIIDKIQILIPSKELSDLRNRVFKKSKKPTFIDSLTKKEKDWLNEHKVIKIGVDAGFAPYAFVDKQGNFKGVAADFAHIISKMLNIKMVMVPGLSWPQIIQASKDKTIDLITTASYRPEREEFLNFTKGYIPTPLVIMARSDDERIKNRDDIKGLRIALVKKYSSSKSVLKEYRDQFEPYFVDTPLEGLKALSMGKSDGYIGVLGINIHQSIQSGISNLKVATSYNLETNYQNYGVRKDWPILAEILDKALDEISDEDKISIFQKWVPIKASKKDKTISLNKEEQKWLKSHNFKVKMCIDSNWMPFEKLDNKGKYIGMGADYMNMFSKKLGYPIELFKTASWSESLEKIKAKECDILPLAMRTPHREKYLNFTDPYLSFPLVIATKNDELYIDKIEDILDKELGMVKGYAYINILKKRYPNIKIKEVKSVKEGLEKVNKGEIYGFIDAIATIAYEIQKSKMIDVKISGQTGDKWELGIGVRDDSKELLSIFQKLVDSINEEDAAKINSKWVSVRFEYGFDYTLLWKVLFGVSLIIAVFIYWNRKLAHEVELRIKAEDSANRANAAKSMFLARMSHEIRTPMNAVLGMLYLTKKTELTTVQKNYIDKSHHAAESLLRVINDILDFSKIEAGKLDIDSTDFDFTEMITRVSSVMSFKAEEKGVELLVRYDEEIPQFLIGDPARIEQILINLIGNAIKFTSKGEVILIPELVEKSKDEITLMFCIKDSGIGINKENQEKLFKEFSQVDGSTTRKFGGSGLGLAISKKLSHIMGGEIWIQESKEGAGSTFCFTVKCKYSKTIRDNSKFVPEFIDKLNILIVDDNPYACKVLYEILSTLKVKSEYVNSGEEAIELIIKEDKRYDLIFMDYKMKGLDGLETFKRLESHLGEKLPKVVMVSAYSHDDILKDVKYSGLKGFITKPVSPSIIYDSILQAYDKQKLQEFKISNYNEESDISSLGGAYILLVEDNEINQEFATILLKDKGISVDIANDGLESLELIKSKKYEAVLMDIQMPNMDGIEAAKRIRQMGEKDRYFKDIPIIAMTAHAMSGDMEKSLSAGMNDHVTKPIEPDKLFSSLLKYIESKVEAEALIKKKDEPNLEFKDMEDSSILDIQEALNRVSGDKKALLNILERFSNKYADSFVNIEEFIKNKEFTSAEKKLHELKGVSGNISAHKLYKVSSDMDSILKKEQEPPIELMGQFKRSLEEVIDKIVSLKDDSKENKKSFDKEKVLKLLEKIDTNLEQNIIESEEGLNELLPYLSDEIYKEFASRLSDTISNFDTDEASLLIERFKKELTNGYLK